jgi:DNA polymerase
MRRREELKEVWSRARGCTRCPQLVAARHTVVFGAGNADADLMFVGEAPGANEDRLGLPFVGQAGALLERLLGEIGLRRDDVFIANVLKCRPPGNRDPLPQEIDNCQEYLFRQLELVRPKVVCTLGNFATKLLRADPSTGITRLHGRDEERVIGPLAVRLLPLLHPAAALYTPAMLATLRADFQRIPELLARERLPAPDSDPTARAVTHPEPALTIAGSSVAGAQAGGGAAAPDTPASPASRMGDGGADPGIAPQPPRLPPPADESRPAEEHRAAADEDDDAEAAATREELEAGRGPLQLGLF